jgi:alpha-beta hydrolase superfamily lysophospholipase
MRDVMEAVLSVGRAASCCTRAAKSATPTLCFCATNDFLISCLHHHSQQRISTSSTSTSTPTSVIIDMYHFCGELARFPAEPGCRRREARGCRRVGVHPHWGMQAKSPCHLWGHPY